jgi:hypothetical protein
MRAHRIIALVGALASFGFTMGSASSASAAVPFWALRGRTLKIQVPDCASTVAAAIQKVTGSATAQSKFSANTIDVRGFTSNGGIFVECSANAALVCGKPMADITITVFSDANDAATLRDAVNSAIGSPVYFDCP